ncbi:MAG TPA: DUF6069 family protein [Streptosporangiaceae bacterium]|nr:DUF6069 family protein [Streptosporangiaceae bacterium]
MTTQRMPPQREPRPQPRHVGRVDEGRLWSGGAATAVVAGLIALVGVLIARWLLAIPLLAPQSDGAFGDAHTTGVVLVAVGAALVATALLNLLLLSTPRPVAFFGWIVALATVLVVVLPFQTTAPLAAKFATAVVGLVIGIAIGTLLSGVAGRSIRSPRRDGGYTEPPLDNTIRSDSEY